MTSEISYPPETKSQVTEMGSSDIYLYSIDDFYDVKNEIRSQLGDLSYFSPETQSVFEKISQLHPFNQHRRRRPNSQDDWRKRRPTTLIKNEDQDQSEKIYQEIKGFCNKISSGNHDTILEEIHKSLDNLKEDRKKYLQLLLNDLVKKARLEPTYCPYYIKLILGLNDSETVKEFIDDLTDKYGKAIDDILPLLVEGDDLADEIEFQKVKSKKEETYDDYCLSRKNKNYQKGFSQFIGELYNYKSVTVQELLFFWSQLVNNLQSLIKATESQQSLSQRCQELIEENILYLAPLVEVTIENVIRTQPQTEKVQNLFQVIHTLSENKKISNKCRYMLADLVDLFNKNVKKIRNKARKHRHRNHHAQTQ